MHISWNQYLFSKDPQWSRKTFLEAAKNLGIKISQAYKWGYHRKIKDPESLLRPVFKVLNLLNTSYNHIEFGLTFFIQIKI